MDVTLDAHKMCFYYGIRLYQRLLDCAARFPQIWNIPYLQKETEKQVNVCLFRVFLNDLGKMDRINSWEIRVTRMSLYYLSIPVYLKSVLLNRWLHCLKMSCLAYDPWTR